MTQVPPALLVLSPCGTSLLTKRADMKERELLTRFANARALDDVGNCRVVIESRVNKAREELMAASLAEVRDLSAELNGILALSQAEAPDARYHHILLCTDTWLGEQTGRIVETWLRCHGHNSVELLRQPDLQTANLQLFQSALTDLVQWLDSTIDGYRQKRYRILFNLTGGFKSVQGFLQTLGNFYADETLYVFEAPGSPLLRIPRLPVKMVASDAVRQHLRVIRRLDKGLSVSNAELLGVPETFLLHIDDAVTLSPWGTVVWEQTRKELYVEQVWPPPSDRIAFGKDFLVSTQNQPGSRLLNLNDKFDKLASYLEGDQSRPVASLDLKKLKGDPKPPSTHEFDAWADRDAKRVYCHYDSHQLILDRLGDALH